MTDLIYTPNQYLVNNIAKARLQYAYNSGDHKIADQAEKYYKDLGEREVTFSEFVYNEKTNKHSTNMTCKGRGFMLKNITFNQGTIAKMLADDAQPLFKLATLKKTSVGGFYLVDESKQMFLLVEKNASIPEALLLTKCNFDPSTYTIELFEQYDESVHAVGVVTINSPIVGGKIYIANIDHGEEEAAAKLKAEEAAKAAAEEAEKQAKAAQDKADEEELARMEAEEAAAKAAAEAESKKDTSSDVTEETK